MLSSVAVMKTSSLSICLTFNTVPISEVAVTSREIKKHPQSNKSPHTVTINPHPLNTYGLTLIAKENPG
jgi:hypothetical protein